MNFLQFDPMMTAAQEFKACKNVFFLKLRFTKSMDIKSGVVITKWDQNLRDNEIKLLLNSLN